MLKCLFFCVLMVTVFNIAYSNDTSDKDFEIDLTSDKQDIPSLSNINDSETWCHYLKTLNPDKERTKHAKQSGVERPSETFSQTPVNQKPDDLGSCSTRAQGFKITTYDSNLQNQQSYLDSSTPSDQGLPVKSNKSCQQLTRKQIQALNAQYKKNKYINHNEAVKLAADINIDDPERITAWFLQNRSNQRNSKKRVRSKSASYSDEEFAAPKTTTTEYNPCYYPMDARKVLKALCILNDKLL